jgi:hypothetical protein
MTVAETKAIGCLSPAAVQCFSAICAGWPLPGELKSEEHSQVSMSTAGFIGVDGLARLSTLLRNWYGLTKLSEPTT